MIESITTYKRRWMTPTNMLFCWHLGLTLMLVWWAVILAFPAPTFTISQSYDTFARICPDEMFWACGYGVASTLSIAGTIAAWPPFCAEYNSKLSSLRMSSALLMGFVHGMTAIFILKAAPTSTGSGIYVLIMCSAYLLLRAEYERA